MRILLVAAVAVSLNVAVIGHASAQSTGTMNGVAHGTGMSKARCTPGDPNVLVDKTAKTYVMDTPAAAPKPGGAMAAAPDAMAASGSGKSAKVSMCKSEADSMGAHKAGGMMKAKSGS